ncbi:hypothetical protein R1flu_003179 [Riccia fluitans]|uniref:PPIase cyclophilin-type domain-containing protein n=1 Tax=Riccia fluitans TaxID=41844 RepID=A0ABD1Y967_9MARC
MRKKHGDSDLVCRQWILFWSVMSSTCLGVYVLLSPVLRENRTDSPQSELKLNRAGADCCRGIDHLEYWGHAVKWGSEHKTNSSQECCAACKAMCPEDGICKCNSWVYCGDKVKCGENLGQCWLKKQEDPLNPDVQESGEHVTWTSGLVFGRDVGILVLMTEHGSIRVKLMPDCAPLSVHYFVEVLKLRHCAGCQIYRAEPRGSFWDQDGQHMDKASTGPPYGLLQGTLDLQAGPFKVIPAESCPVVVRGLVGWVGGGPDFFISLADHPEWPAKHTVFGYVLPEDMGVVEAISALPTTQSEWSGVKISLLETPVSINMSRHDNQVVKKSRQS